MSESNSSGVGGHVISNIMSCKFVSYTIYDWSAINTFDVFFFFFPSRVWTLQGLLLLRGYEKLEVGLMKPLNLESK
jgi:hypothetical protein